MIAGLECLMFGDDKVFYTGLLPLTTHIIYEAMIAIFFFTEKI